MANRESPFADAPVVGTWTLILAAVEPGNSATFEIRQDSTGKRDPDVHSDESSMVFVYEDGVREVFFTANLLSARYVPVDGLTTSTPPREITFNDRVNAGGIADVLHDLGYRDHADRLFDAVRCCDVFPECSHVLEWYEARRGA